MKCNIGYYALTHSLTNLDILLKVLEVSDICSEASGLRALRDGVIDSFPNKWNKQSHETLEKHPLALSQTNTPENETDN